MTTSVLDKLCDLHKLPKHANLFSAIGEKSIILGDTDFDELQGKRKPSSEGYSAKWRKYVPFLKRSSQKEGSFTTNDSTTNIQDGLIVVDQGLNKKKPIFINEDNISRYIFPHCCHPIPAMIFLVTSTTKGI